MGIKESTTVSGREVTVLRFDYINPFLKAVDHKWPSESEVTQRAKGTAFIRTTTQSSSQHSLIAKCHLLISGDSHSHSDERDTSTWSRSQRSDHWFCIGDDPLYLQSHSHPETPEGTSAVAMGHMER